MRSRRIRDRSSLRSRSRRSRVVPSNFFSRCQTNLTLRGATGSRRERGVSVERLAGLDRDARWRRIPSPRARSEASRPSSSRSRPRARVVNFNFFADEAFARSSRCGRAAAWTRRSASAMTRRTRPSRERWRRTNRRGSREGETRRDDARSRAGDASPSSRESCHSFALGLRSAFASCLTPPAPRSLSIAAPRKRVNTSRSRATPRPR